MRFRLAALGPRRVAAAAVLLALAAAAVAGLLRTEVDTRPAAFLPADDPSVTALDEVATEFGGDAVVVLLETEQPRQLLHGDQLPRLLRLEGQLAAQPDVQAVFGPATTLNQLAISSQNLLLGLTGKRDAARATAEGRARAGGATDAAVTAAGDAAVTAFDQRYVPLLVQGLPAGLPTLRNAGFVDTVLFEQSGLPRDQWRFVVPTPNSVAIVLRPRAELDQVATDRLVDGVRDVVAEATTAPPPVAGSEEQAEAPLDTSRVTVTGVPVVGASMADRVRAEAPLLGTIAVLVIGTCYVLLSWTPRKRDRVLPILATLTATATTVGLFGLLGRPLSIGAVAFLPILVGIGSDFPAYLVHGARRRQVLVAALASAGGFGALAFSPLPFVRDLGLALAVGVVLAVGVALLLRQLVPPVPTVDHPVEPDTAEAELRSPAWPERAAVAACVVAVAAVGWIALPRLDLKASPEELAAGLTAVDDAAHAEQIMGSSGEIRIVLRGPDVLRPEAMDWMHRAEDAVVRAHGSSLRPIVTLPDLFRFLGDNPSRAQADAAAGLLPAYVVDSVLSRDSRTAVLSFGIQLQDLGDQKALLDDLRTLLPAPPEQFGTEITGLPVLAARGYELVEADRWLAGTAGIAVAGAILMVGLRRRSDALRSITAAGLATGWGLAAAAVTGMTLSPLTIALGSLTTATACEFTVVLADARRSGRHRAAAGRGLRRTLLVAALAAAAGYACLAASGLVVLREFGALLAIAVLLSLAAARLVLWLAPPTTEGPAPIEAAAASAPTTDGIDEEKTVMSA